MADKLKLSVRDFAVPAPRTGSIDPLSGFGRAAELGQELHRQIQARRAKESPAYRAEAWTQRRFEAGGFVFEVGGRLDGLFDELVPRVEEIKTTFAVRELARRVREAPDAHPYALQLRTYGYFHYKRTGELPLLNLLLVSTRSGETLDVPLALDVPEYERWLERRLAELVAEAESARKRAARRRKAAAALSFPFERPRPGQRELAAEVAACIQEGRPLLLQAPTGLGKTVGVLEPVLRDALARGQRAVYVTPKNSQHAVAEDAVSRLHDGLAGAGRLKSLTLTAKGKLCMKDEPLCDPAYCEFARGHYEKVAASGVVAALARKRRLTARVFKKAARDHQVCPYELQFDVAQDADVVIGDYNYVFSPRAALSGLAARGLDQDGKPALIVDEAHNLPARAMDYYSPELSTAELERWREPLSSLPAVQRLQALALLDDCVAAVAACGEGAAEPREIPPPAEAFLSLDERLRAFLAAYLSGDAPVGPRDPVVRLCGYWAEFAEALERLRDGAEGFFTTWRPSPPAVRITCCDPAPLLAARYEDFAHVVGFSATLKPFQFYGRLSGLPAETLRTVEFSSPFPSGNRKLLLIPQLSSRWSRRAESAPRVAEAVARIAALRRGNYFAFFPSFEFMERALARFTPPPGFDVLRQERRMSRDAVEDVLARLAAPGSAAIVFAVQGGVFAEGVDYPGEMAVGAFVVGPPLPTFDFERELMRGYYEKRYGGGFDFAYVYPAMAKAVQAAGRVIRSETDRGLIVLMDDRFAAPAFAKCMPKDWFQDDPRELVSAGILADVERFWSAA